MNAKLFSALLIVSSLLLSIVFTSCDKDNNPIPPTTSTGQFVSQTSPYLICATRNPGGVGFDFRYKNSRGGANNMDSLTVSDFEYDLFIKTMKAEKPDGSIGGAPYIKLFGTLGAVNYSAIDTSCKGLTDFQNLNSTNIQNYTLQSDDAGFNLSSVPTGTTGYPLMQQLIQEYNKLVLGERWKDAAGNDIEEDEPIWLIKTREGVMVKFIVTDFPAEPAPTSTGYIEIEWDFIN